MHAAVQRKKCKNGGHHKKLYNLPLVFRGIEYKTGIHLEKHDAMSFLLPVTLSNCRLPEDSSRLTPQAEPQTGQHGGALQRHSGIYNQHRSSCNLRSLAYDTISVKFKVQPIATFYHLLRWNCNKRLFKLLYTQVCGHFGSSSFFLFFYHKMAM